MAKNTGTYSRPERDAEGEIFPEDLQEQSVDVPATGVERKAAKAGTLAGKLADSILEGKSEGYTQPYGPPGMPGKVLGDPRETSVRIGRAEEEYRGAAKEHQLARQTAQETIEQHQSTVPLAAGPNASPEGGMSPIGGEDEFLSLTKDRLEKEMQGQMGESAAQVRNMARMQALQTQAMHYIGMEGEERTRARMGELQKAYDEAIVDLGSLRVDPKRWEEDTPAVAQVLMALASSAFAFFTGGQGPNPVVQLIDKAIDRDMKAQMQGIQGKMKAAGLGLEQQDALAKMEAGLTSSMYQRVLNVTESMMKESQFLGASEDMVMAHQQIFLKAKDVELRRLALYAQAAERQQKFEAGGKWDDAQMGRSVVESRTSADDIGMLYELWKKARQIGGVGGSVFGKASAVAGGAGEILGLGSTEMNEYNALKEAKILSIAAVMNKGRPTDKDFKAVAKLLPTSGLGDDAGAQRGGQMLDKYWRETENTYNTLSPRDKAKAGPAIRETLAGLAEVVSRNPELLPNISNDLRSAIGRINGQQRE